MADINTSMIERQELEEANTHYAFTVTNCQPFVEFPPLPASPLPSHPHHIVALRGDLRLELNAMS